MDNLKRDSKYAWLVDGGLKFQIGYKGNGAKYADWMSLNCESHFFLTMRATAERIENKKSERI